MNVRTLLITEFVKTNHAMIEYVENKLDKTVMPLTQWEYWLSMKSWCLERVEAVVVYIRQMVPNRNCSKSEIKTFWNENLKQELVRAHRFIKAILTKFLAKFNINL